MFDKIGVLPKIVEASLEAKGLIMIDILNAMVKAGFTPDTQWACELKPIRGEK